MKNGQVKDMVDVIVGLKVKDKVKEVDMVKEVMKELLKYVVEEVVWEGWMSGMRYKAEELLDLPLTGEHIDSKLKCDTCVKVFSTKRLPYFHKRNQYMNRNNDSKAPYPQKIYI